MSSTMSLVRLVGMLRDSRGTVTACKLGALKVGLPGSGDCQLTRFRLLSTEKPLPDGSYTLAVNGQTHDVRLHLGQLVSADGM